LQKIVKKNVLITGANGNLGQRLIRRLAADFLILAVVRSEHAKKSLMSAIADLPGVEVLIADYNDESTLANIAKNCTYAFHLVGIIKASRENTYDNAHQGPCRVLSSVAQQADLERIVYLSLLGSDINSTNACLASRGEAERILMEGAVPTVVMRIPMVLGENDYASRSLRKKSGLVFDFRSSSKEQPIYAGDVIEAMVQAMTITESGIIELAGPESLTRASLIRRAAGIAGKHAVVISLPLAMGMLIAKLLEWCLPVPPVTRDMLGILDHDDDIDATKAGTRLGIYLTSLDDTLRKVVSS
jgi:uncharacterized protein YbjT (DUF2867 family)